jgi:hypothetical protein
MTSCFNCSLWMPVRNACTGRSQHCHQTAACTLHWLLRAAGMSPSDYLPPRSAGQQEWQLPQQQQQQQQQAPAAGNGFVPAVQPKLAPQYCVDGPDAVADPLASLLLDDGGAASAGGSRYVSAGGASEDADVAGRSRQQQAPAVA